MDRDQLEAKIAKMKSAGRHDQLDSNDEEDEDDTGANETVMNLAVEKASKEKIYKLEILLDDLKIESALKSKRLNNLERLNNELTDQVEELERKLNYELQKKRELESQLKKPPDPASSIIATSTGITTIAPNNTATTANNASNENNSTARDEMKNIKPGRIDLFHGDKSKEEKVDDWLYQLERTSYAHASRIQ